MTGLRHSIALRLFAVTFAGMLLFVAILLSALAGGFSNFYEQKQKKDIAADLNKIRDLYVREGGDRGGLFPRDVGDGSGRIGIPADFDRFEAEYDASVAVVTLQERRVSILILDGGATDSVSNEPPAPVRIGGADGTSVFLLPKGPDVEKGERIQTAMNRWRQDTRQYADVMLGGKTLVYRTSGSDGRKSAELIAVTALLRDGNGNGQVLFAVSSLQPITHASSVFKDLSVYVFGFAFVIVGLLAVGYAAIVTRPLRRLNGIAGRLARLDFSTRSGWKRKDEIGELSRTFDFLADNLEGTLAELTAANEKLKREIENEKRLERMRREFVAGVSHELKTPLSLIGGYAEGLRDNIGTGAKRERYADVILEETRRMTAIVGDMLDLSHLESGRYTLKPEEIEAAELLGEAAERAEALGAAKNASVSVKLPEESGEDALPPIVADRQRIGQVLTNLVTNAVRHAPQGGAIELAAQFADGEWRLFVFNEGEPIPEEEQPRIWSQFYRTDRSRSRDSGGTGIGLAIVRQILELHGSRYDVRNERGGVMFGFTLRASANPKPNVPERDKTGSSPLPPDEPER